jgi:hypothetical protein
MFEYNEHPQEGCSMKDEDILQIIVFASSPKWCLQKAIPCVPVPACNEEMVDGICKYEFREDQTR